MNWSQNPALRPISLAIKTKRGTVGTINKCERWLPRRSSLPVHSAATIACAAPLILADAQGYFADHPATPTATAATTTASTPGKRTHIRSIII